MNIIDKLKKFFSNFKKGKEQKLLTSGQSKPEPKKNWREELAKNSNVNKTLNFKRDDGSTLSLTPRMQLNGEQEYETIKNEITGNLTHIPVYTILNENNQEGAQILAYKILLDIPEEQLNKFQPDEMHFLINTLLSKERIEKVVNQYEGYAGGIYREQSTRNA